LTVKTVLGQVIGEVEFNTSDFEYDKYMGHRLYLNLKNYQDL